MAKEVTYHYNYVEPDVDVGKPREIPQRPDLPSCDAHEHEKDVEGKVAKFESNDAYQRLPVTDDEQRHVEQKLSGLEGIEDVAHPAAEGPLAQISVARHGVFGAVVVAVKSPDDLAGEDGQQIEEDIYQDAGPNAKLRKCLGSA